MQEFLDILQNSCGKLIIGQDNSETLIKIMNHFPYHDTKIETKIFRQKKITEMIKFVLNLKYNSFDHVLTVILFTLSILKKLEQHTLQNFYLETKGLEGKLETELLKIIQNNNTIEIFTSLKKYAEFMLQAHQNSIFSSSILNTLKKHFESSEDCLKLYLKTILDPDFEALKIKGQLESAFLHSIFKKYSGMLVNQENFKGKVLKLEQAAISDQESIIRADYYSKEAKSEIFCFDFNVLLALNQTKSLIKLKGLKYNISGQKQFFSLFLNYFGKPLYRYIEKLGPFLEEEKILFILKQIIVETLNLQRNNIFIEFLHPCNVFLHKNRVSILPKVYFAKYYNNLMGEIEIQSFCHEDPAQRLGYSVGLLFLYMKSRNLPKPLTLESQLNYLSNPTRAFICNLLTNSLSLPDSLLFLKTSLHNP
jgi:hypothetical protein